MASLTVCRSPRNGNFFTISNYYLRDRSLSMKAKGLFTLLLSLPESWDFSLRGLASISKEGVDAIREAVRELEKFGYIVRTRIRNAKGQMDSAEYTLYEQPQTPEQNPQAERTAHENTVCASKEPTRDIPKQEKPGLENPTLVFPEQENPTQRIPSYPVTPVTPKIKNNILNNRGPYPIPSNPTDTGNVRPFPAAAQNQPVSPSVPPAEEKPIEPIDPTENLWQLVKDNVCYNELSQEYGKETMDEIVGIIVGVLLSRRLCYRFGNNMYPAGLVKKQFFKVNKDHIEYVFNNINKTAPDIHDPVAYVTRCIFSATLSLNLHTAAKVQHGVYRQEKHDQMLAEEAEWDRIIEAETPDYWEEIIDEIKRQKGSADQDAECGVPVDPAACRTDADRLFACCAG